MTPGGGVGGGLGAVACRSLSSARTDAWCDTACNAPLAICPTDQCVCTGNGFVKRVYILFSTHFDCGYAQTYWSEKDNRTIVSGTKAADVINRYFDEHFAVAADTAAQVRLNTSGLRDYKWMTQAWLVRSTARLALLAVQMVALTPPPLSRFRRSPCTATAPAASRSASTARPPPSCRPLRPPSSWAP
jgi:hypothetical protein